MAKSCEINYVPAENRDQYLEIFRDPKNRIIRTLDDFDSMVSDKDSQFSKSYSKMDRDRRDIFRGGLVFNPFGYGLSGLRMDALFDRDFVEDMRSDFPTDCLRCYSNRKMAYDRVIERSEFKELDDNLFIPFGFRSNVFLDDKIWFYACVAGTCILAGVIFICISNNCGFSWPKS